MLAASIEGVCAFTGEGRGIIHLLIADDAVDRAAQPLERTSMAIADRREVLVVDIADQPGSVGELARELTAAGVNIRAALHDVRARQARSSPPTIWIAPERL